MPSMVFACAHSQPDPPAIPPLLMAVTLFLALSGVTACTCHAQAGQPPFRLIGTITGTARNGAVIDDKTAGQTVYHEQELLPDGSRIRRILSDRITIVRSDGTSYDLYINSSTGLENTAPPAAIRDQPPPQVQAPAIPAPRADRERTRNRRNVRSSEEE